MYNKQLDTFLKIAELGSFSKAADALYITPSAVIQQINALERDLEVRLLVRSRRGVNLTPAGELLCREGARLVEQSRYIRRALTSLAAQEQKEIRVGTSLLSMCRVFYSFWNRFAAGSEDCRVVMRNITYSAPEEDPIDIMESVFWGKSSLLGMRFLELARVPLVCAVYKEHPLAQKSLLQYEDMRGQTLVTVDSPHFSDSLQALRREAEIHGVRILPVTSYDLPVFSMCAANGYLLQIPRCWQDIHPQLIPVPCAWDYTLPYGFFYREGSPPARRFIAFVETCLKDPGFSLPPI